MKKPKSVSKLKKVWSTGYADSKIKEYIFERDKNACVLCGRKKGDIILDPSHFWGRYKSSTRFRPDNLDAVCRGCHFRIEHAKQGEYREFKIKQMGMERYKELEKIYYQSKMSRRDAIIELMDFLNGGEKV